MQGSAGVGGRNNNPRCVREASASWRGADFKNKACGQVPECYSTSGVMPELLIWSYCVQQRVSIRSLRNAAKYPRFRPGSGNNQG